LFAGIIWTNYPWQTDLAFTATEAGLHLWDPLPYACKLHHHVGSVWLCVLGVGCAGDVSPNPPTPSSRSSGDGSNADGYVPAVMVPEEVFSR